MGSCFSSDVIAYTSDPSTAKVISAIGNLREYHLPVTVSQVLQIETPSCFLSNSDSLLLDDYIPALDFSEELQAGQIYFVLPTSHLQYRLPGPYMAALAVKASTAISQSLWKNVRRNKKIRISPVLDPELNNKNQRLGINGGFDRYYEHDGFRTSNDNKSRIGVSRSADNIRKLQRNSSRRTKFAISSFQMRLSTIYEGSVVD
ncbi:uncharacterized protein LOC122073779 [Macadamia integrifolia]|uniref:uncharacterized protein LOC122073779 n=1 Tax=Macadamia integrifolia TaxID=60698 RepID=UPI001C4FAD93|nr:uncharacterized protein LOC122073779 [Macadamia integrifolia]